VGAHDGRDLVGPRAEGVGELRAARERSLQVLDGAEQQLRLPLRLRQGGDERQEVGVVGSRRRSHSAGIAATSQRQSQL
jgi:hypothetical protein